MESTLSSKSSPLMFLGFLLFPFFFGFGGCSSARGAASLRAALLAPARPRAARAGVVPAFLPQFRSRWRVRLAGGGGCPPPPLWSRLSRGGGGHPRTAPHSPAQPRTQPRTQPRQFQPFSGDFSCIFEKNCIFAIAYSTYCFT